MFGKLSLFFSSLALRVVWDEAPQNLKDVPVGRVIRSDWLRLPIQVFVEDIVPRVEKPRKRPPKSQNLRSVAPDWSEGFLVSSGCRPNHMDRCNVRVGRRVGDCPAR
uniref:Secreted protein n=1 Tax=Odontella aurita TaxID=265563 RepID=A0A7S4KD21_9STRA|mmetsp:Transcript_972/g.2792  ORF Transcript_972/g.2792 Transcript_972/m.2792 type:complete len:107 (+) Transcript_972:192-512(+)